MKQVRDAKIGEVSAVVLVHLSHSFQL